MTHSEIGTALAPRRAGDDAIVVEHRGRDVVDAGARELYPPHSGRVEPGEDRVPCHVPAEECVGLEPAGRIANGELHEFDVGIRGRDAGRLRSCGAELSDDAHDVRS